MPRIVITPEKAEFIKSNRLKMSSRKLADALGCSRTAVQNYLRKNGLTIPKSLVKEFRHQGRKGSTIFTKEMDRQLKAKYLDVAVKPLARELGVSYGCVARRLEHLGLVIPKSVINARKNATRFQKGQECHNKGKSQKEFISPEGMKKVRASYFKKGSVPHNQASKDGVVRIRTDTKTQKPYKYIRIRPGKWELYQREVWRKQKGKIPRGYLVTFKDGNSLNCDLDNLECISKKENAIRNMDKFRDYPTELQSAIKLKNKLIKNLRTNEQT